MGGGGKREHGGLGTYLFQMQAQHSGTRMMAVASLVQDSSGSQKDLE